MSRLTVKAPTGLIHLKNNMTMNEAIKKLSDYEELEEQGKLVELPCAAGDWALFSGGYFLPVIYVTVSQTGITVGCQNGIKVTMDMRQCKGFYKTREEAEAALKELERSKGK